MGKAATSVTQDKVTPKKRVSFCSKTTKKQPAVDRVLGAILALEKIMGRENVPRERVVAFARVTSATEPCVLSKLQMEGRILYNKKTIRITEKGRSMDKSPSFGRGV